MRKIIESVERYLPGFAGLFSRGTARPEATQTTLSGYTYTKITQICDQALAPDRKSVREIRRRDEKADSIYHGLDQEDRPAPITAAVVIGLARVSNLEAQDVSILGGITYLLPTIGRQYRPFCAAIDRNIQATEIMSARPDYASSRQLAVIAKGSFDALRALKWRPIRFTPYVTLEGQIISSRRQFVASLRDDEDIAGACVRTAVDLGVLTTQPEKLSQDETEWLRRNIHYIKMGGTPRLNGLLENFNSLLSIQ